MTHPWLDDAKAPTTCTEASSSRGGFSQSTSHSSSRHNSSNISKLLAWREISPRTKQLSKRCWGEASKWRTDCSGQRCNIKDARRSLVSWVEAESLRHLSAKYCPLLPPPRSTIAAAFSSDGKTLASTHGDHTVKIIDCQTGNCLKVFCGHRRTPWVVRFHPLYPEIFASGSLDHEVRLWDANTGDCIGSRDFYKPIASIAFHAQGEFLAVASGHKLYIWNYNRRGEAPTVLLKTRRSLRAVHFHPHGAPFLVTAEVNDLDSPDSPLTLATSPGYLQYPPPAVYFANIHSSTDPQSENNVPLVPSTCLFGPTFLREEGRTSLHGIRESRMAGSVNQQGSEPYLSNQRHTYSTVQRLYDNTATAMEMSPGENTGLNSVPEDTVANSLLTEMETADSECMMDTVEPIEGQSANGFPQEHSHGIREKSDDVNNVPSSTSQYNGASVRIPFRRSRLGAEGTPAINPSNLLGNADLQMLLRNVESGQLRQLFPFGDPACWEIPFLQGWLMGQTHAGLHPMLSPNSSVQGNASAIRGMGSDILASDLLPSRNMETLVVSSAAGFGHLRSIGQSGVRHRSRSRPTASLGSGESAALLHVQNDNSESQPGGSNVDSEVAASLAAAAAAELPCTVKLRIWPHDIQNPCAPLDAETCRLTIPHAVLCSEMGAHFSPCGRYLAACIACMVPHMEVDTGLQSQIQHDASGIATSPTRHPISAHQVMYELRIYSLEEATFGMVLASRAIRAAHCLTSIQFSPTSEHILLAYGRRHSSLLRSIVIDGETTIPFYTILEVYSVSDMELVRVLPSAEDEVNVACFHPLVGGGLVYGTKEGKLRILQYDGPHGTTCIGSNFSLDEHMLEVQRYALEC